MRRLPFVVAFAVLSSVAAGQPPAPRPDRPHSPAPNVPIQPIQPVQPGLHEWSRRPERPFSVDGLPDGNRTIGGSSQNADWLVRVDRGEWAKHWEIVIDADDRHGDTSEGTLQVLVNGDPIGPPVDVKKDGSTLRFEGDGPIDSVWILPGHAKRSGVGFGGDEVDLRRVSVRVTQLSDWPSASHWRLTEVVRTQRPGRTIGGSSPDREIHGPAGLTDHRQFRLMFLVHDQVGESSKAAVEIRANGSVIRPRQSVAKRGEVIEAQGDGQLRTFSLVPFRESTSGGGKYGEEVAVPTYLLFTR